MNLKITEKHLWILKMLKDKDRIFQNLYNDLGSDVFSSQKRGDWVNTKEITDKGRDWIKIGRAHV